jgi:hypothetical protein
MFACGSGGLADHQKGPDGVLASRPAFCFDHSLQSVKCSAAGQIARDANRRQWRMAETGERDIVSANDGNIVRYFQASFNDGPHGAERAQIVAA